MATVVQKYGGSSVAGPEKLRAVAQRVADRHRAGDRVVVVVSAMGDTTDELLALARAVSPSPPRRELDMLLTAGERISMALLSMALHELGVPAISFTGSQSGIITSEDHSNARILEVRPVRLVQELDQGRVVIVAGYQGVSRTREVTTLGRGGSDTTAVALAAALDATTCEIYSDVDGVFTADPRVVPQARRLAEIRYEEMQALSEHGARVLNAQAVEFARRAGIEIHARASWGGEGTRVRSVASGPSAVVAGVTGETDAVFLSLEGPAAVGDALEVFQGLSAAPRAAWVGNGGCELQLSLENLHCLPELEAELARRLGAAARLRRDRGVVTAVGLGIGSDPSVLPTALRALREAGIAADRVVLDPVRVQAVVEAQRVPDAVRAFHRALIEEREAPTVDQ